MHAAGNTEWAPPLIVVLTSVCGVVRAVLIAALVSGSLTLWRFQVLYAAELQTVTSSAGRRYDVLVHRDGVMLYTKGEGIFNAYSIFPTVIALVRRWRRGPWRWAITVRQSRFHGYPDLLREVVDDDRTARRRAQEIAQQLQAGERLWPQERES